MSSIIIREQPLTASVLKILLSMSAEWVQEDNVYAYVANGPADIEGNRIFLAYDGDAVIGYALGNGYSAQNMRSILADEPPCFEIEELYVRPSYRSKGIGRQIMDAICAAVKGEYEAITLTTATKNCRAILHFYIDKIGMIFWSARLFKRL